MSDEPTPIAYTALQPGTPVLLNDGKELGTCAAVLQIEDLDVFDGIVVDIDGESRFVDADHIGQITTAAVHTTLGAADVPGLPVPDGPPVYRADASDATGRSLSDKLSRWFGRGKWKQED
jgi:hypothetical protein